MLVYVTFIIIDNCIDLTCSQVHVVIYHHHHNSSLQYLVTGLDSQSNKTRRNATVVEECTEIVTDWAKNDIVLVQNDQDDVVLIF